jgi:hypothetical protein
MELFLIDFRTYGTPTIRSDLAPPRLRRVVDTTNYGDESDAYGLTNPSVYSNRGVYERDLLIPRTMGEVSLFIIRTFFSFFFFFSTEHFFVYNSISLLILFHKMCMNDKL